MDTISPADMLKILEDEAERLCEIEQKILNQLHHLQVEETVYTQAMKQLEGDFENGEAENGDFEAELDRELAVAMKTTLEVDEQYPRIGAAATENEQQQQLLENGILKEKLVRSPVNQAP